MHLDLNHFIRRQREVGLEKVLTELTETKNLDCLGTECYVSFSEDKPIAIGEFVNNSVDEFFLFD